MNKDLNNWLGPMTETVLKGEEMSRQQEANRSAAKGLVIALLLSLLLWGLIIFGILSLRARADDVTICVRTPLLVDGEAAKQIKTEAEEIFHHYGIRTDCTKYDARLLYYATHGSGYYDQSTVSLTRVPRGVFGTITSQPTEYWFANWTVVLWRKDESGSLYRHHGLNLRSELKRLAKKLRKANKDAG